MVVVLIIFVYIAMPTIITAIKCTRVSKDFGKLHALPRASKMHKKPHVVSKCTTWGKTEETSSEFMPQVNVYVIQAGVHDMVMSV